MNQDIDNNTPLVKVDNLVRHFGLVKAVNHVSFTLARGHVIGLIGANGAGKTTLMRMLATLDTPDMGDIFINGIHAIAYPEKIRNMIGWMPDDFRPYENTSVREYLDFFARAYGLKADEIIPRVDEVIDFTELTDLQDRLMDKLSKGQTQRLCLARTLISDPSLLILDEPAAGLDPKARLEFKNLVRILKNRGKTVLISSHILSELGEMCDSLIFMDMGGIVHEGDKDILLQHEEETGWLYEIKVSGDAQPLELWMNVRPGWTHMETRNDGVLARFHSTEAAALAEELKKLCQEFAVYDFHRCDRKLEDAFIDILRNKGKSSPAPVSIRVEASETIVAEASIVSSTTTESGS